MLEISHTKKSLVPGKGMKKIFVSQIECISKSSYSPRFQLYYERNKKALAKAIKERDTISSQKIYSQHAEAVERSISITYYKDEEQHKFDFMVSTAEEYELLFSALNSLLLDYKRCKSKVHADVSFIENIYETYLQIDPTGAIISLADLIKAFQKALKGMATVAHLKQANISDL